MQRRAFAPLCPCRSSSLQAEADELSRRRPPAPERSRQVATWLAQRGAALEAQRGVADGRQLELIAAEAGLRAAETELEFLADAREELEEAKVGWGGARALVVDTWGELWMWDWRVGGLQVLV